MLFRSWRRGHESSWLSWSSPRLVLLLLEPAREGLFCLPPREGSLPTMRVARIVVAHGVMPVAVVLVDRDAFRAHAVLRVRRMGRGDPGEAGERNTADEAEDGLLHGRLLVAWRIRHMPIQRPGACHDYQQTVRSVTSCNGMVRGRAPPEIGRAHL